MILSLAAVATAGGLTYAGIKIFKYERISEKRDQKFSWLLTAANHSKETNIEAHNAESHNLEKTLNQNFKLALISLGFTTTGALVYPLLTLVSIPLLVYTSIGFIRGGYESIKERRVGMAVVDAIALPGMIITGHLLIASIAYSLYYLGRKLSHKVKDHSQRGITGIFQQQAHFVWIQRDNTEIQIPFEQLQRGDIVVVEAGETILVDGIVVSGYASVDQHILTGESQPLEREADDSVFASTIVLSGKICVRVKESGQETVSAKIAETLLHTADYKTSVQLRGEQMADKTALPLLSLSALTLPFLGVASALTILQAGFGYIMRVIAPISTMNFLNIALQEGVLIKDGRALEVLNKVDTIVFDKTGTLTLEQPHVGRIYTYNGFSENELLGYAAAAETKQSHPIAHAIVEASQERGLRRPMIGEANYKIGYGITVRSDDRIIQVGSKRFMEIEGIPHVAKSQTHQEIAFENGHSLVYVAIDGRLGGVIEICPTIRPEAMRVVQALHQRNLSIVLISGDHEYPTRKLAQQLGIATHYANTLPEDKAVLIKEMQNNGKFVCFIGDGINDAIALKQAQVSISLQGAATIATDTAQIILIQQNLDQLLCLFDLVERFEANIKANALITTIPGIICIGGVYFLHFGILAGCVLFDVALLMGLSNAMLPLLSNQLKKVPKTLMRSC